GRGRNPAPDEHGPADFSMTDSPAPNEGVRLPLLTTFTARRDGRASAVAGGPWPSSTGARTGERAPAAKGSDGAGEARRSRAASGAAPRGRAAAAPRSGRGRRDSSARGSRGRRSRAGSPRPESHRAPP